MKKRILYADDSADLRRYFARAAERLGYECVTVDDGAQAWELIQQGAGFDLIVSDHDMPEMTGLEFLKLVRENPLTKDVYLVLYTGTDSEAVQKQAQELGIIFEDKGKMLSLRDLIQEHMPT